MIKKIIEKISNEASPSFDELVNAFSSFIPLLNKLKSTEQDITWHGEGNVHTHTSKVLQALYQLLEREKANLNPKRRLALLLATAFHDIAKPLTTRKKEINGKMRMVAPHHEKVGASYLATILLEQGLPYPILFQTLQLIFAHGMPKRLVIDGAEKNEYYKLARQADLELLYYLAKADILGRICPDKDRQVELIDLFRLFVEEFKLWGKTDPYDEWPDALKNKLKDHSENVLDYVMGCGIKDFEKGLIHTPYEAMARAYPRINDFPELVITCGMSGSGKTTWIKQTLPEFEIISLDNLRDKLLKDRGNQSKNAEIFNIAMESLKKLLRKNKRIVWDATNLRHDIREKIIRAAENYNALITLAVFHLNENDLRKRNHSRMHPVPEEALTRQLQRFQWPQPIEAHRSLILNSEGKPLHCSGYYLEGQAFCFGRK